MRDNGYYLTLKTKITNDFILGNDKAPMTIVTVKRVLSYLSLPVNSKVDLGTADAADRMGLAFVKTQDWLKNTNCFGCSDKGQYRNKLFRTTAARDVTAFAEKTAIEK